MSVCFWSKEEIFNTSQNVNVYILWNNLYKKLVLIKFCSDYDLPNFAKEKSCDKYPQIESEYIFYG